VSLSRREALGALAATGLVAAGCGRTVSLAPDPKRERPQRSDEPEARLLNRLGYGPRPGEVAKLKETGQKAWLDDQLGAGQGDPLGIQAHLFRLPIMHLGPWDLRDWPERDVVAQMQEAALVRAVHSPYVVRERLVDFWTNHFSVYARKGMGAYRKPMDERTVVRAHVLGSFGDMLRASSKSAAMLVYLDQQASTDTHPNENYARELLELHTLGVDGGYTQKDVMEVARCFTGWTEERGFLRKKGAFRFDADIHDRGAKTVLGHRIPAGGGVEDGERVVEILIEHPSTARHVSRKFCRFFLGDAGATAEPRVRETFVRTKGDVPSMVRALVDGPELLGPEAGLKRPYDFLVSTVRATEARVDNWRGLQTHLEHMGQPLYQWPMPDGYPMDTEAWTSSVLSRWNFALDLTHGRVPGVSVDLDRLQRTHQGAPIADVLFAGPAPEAVAKAADAAPTLAEAAAVCLASPEFQWR
jgi:uncharacterized protein (DUF1800 family)